MKTIKVASTGLLSAVGTLSVMTCSSVAIMQLQPFPAPPLNVHPSGQTIIFVQVLIW